jgi:hypothetical protein
VPERCTCGAVLPEDARFCHKCGKPQRDEPLIAEQQEETPAAPPVVVAPPSVAAFESAAISFHNAPAVRIALIAGLAAFFCSVIAGQFALPQEFAFVWLAASGFFAVYLYRRRTGQRLSMMNGARLGWICGLFGFIVVTLALCATAILLSDPQLVSAMRDQLRTHGLTEANADQMIQLFRSPSGILAALSVSFVLFSALPAFGGAIGAKLLDRE